jgi:hypothetical protein
MPTYFAFLCGRLLAPSEECLVILVRTGWPFGSENKTMRQNTRLSVDRLEERLAFSSAPLLDTSVTPSMLEIAEDAGPPQGAVGTPVASLIDHGGSLNNFSDADGDVPGIAIIQTATQGGTLWSSTDDGVTWEPVEGVSASNPEVLFATPGNRLYFEPAPNLNGVVDELFSFRAVGVAAEAVATWQGRHLGTPETITAENLGQLGIASGDGKTLIEFDIYSQTVRSISIDAASGELIQGNIQLQDISDGVSQHASVAISHDGGTAMLVEAFQTATNLPPSATAATYLNLENPTSPSLIISGEVVVGGPSHLTQWYGHAFAEVNGNPSAVVATFDANGLLVFDVMDQIFSLEGAVSRGGVEGFAVSPFYHLSYAIIRTSQWISADGSKAIISGTTRGYSTDIGEHRSYFAGVNLAKSAGPTPVRGATMSANTQIVQAAFSEDGNFFYVIESGGAFSIYDTAEVTRPALLSRVDVPAGTSLRVLNDLGIVLVGAADGSVTAVDVANAESAFVVDTVYSFAALRYEPTPQHEQMHMIATDDAEVLYIRASGTIYEGPNVSHYVRYENSSLNAFSVDFGSVSANVLSVDDHALVTGGNSGVVNAARVAASTLRVIDADGLGDYGVFALQTPPQHGSAVVFDSSGQWLYYAGPSFAGEDQFTVRITDVAGGYTDQVISVTGEPSRTIGFLANMVIHQSYSTSAASYSLPALGPEGELLDGKVARITATSSNTALIPHPTPIYASADIPESISFTPVVDASGMATISIQVEDGGADNDLATAEDNGRATHQIEVKVLEVISSASGVVLSKDEANHIYAATQPIMLEQQQAPALIQGFAAIGAEEGNVLLVERGGTTNRLVAEEGWSIRDLFHSLRNNSSAILNPASRDPKELSLTAIAGAYEIDGIENQMITVRRGQRVTFDLNVTGHPFYLQTTGGGYVPANVYSEGFGGNGQTSGRYEWVVPEDAPDELFYQCEFHPVMFGKIVVVD